jgi:hypothetical protein
LGACRRAELAITLEIIGWPHTGRATVAAVSAVSEGDLPFTHTELPKKGSPKCVTLRPPQVSLALHGRRKIRKCDLTIQQIVTPQGFDYLVETGQRVPALLRFRIHSTWKLSLCGDPEKL